MLLNRQLTELARDVPVGVGPHDLRPVPWDREKIHQLFDTLQFRVLRDRLYPSCPTASSPWPPGGRPADRGRRGVRRDGDRAWARTRWPPGWPSTPALPSRSGLAATGIWGRGTGNLTGLAIAAPDGACAFIDPTTLTQDDDQALGGWLADPGRPKALHDAKGPIHALAARGLTLAGLTSDTALAAYLALPGQRTLRPGRPGAAVPEPGAAGRDGRPPAS